MHGPEFQHGVRLGTGDAPAWKHGSHLAPDELVQPLLSLQLRGEHGRYLLSAPDLQPLELLLKMGSKEIQPLKIFIRVSLQIPRNLQLPLD